MLDYDFLTPSDIERLKYWGYSAESLDQIDRAYALTIYTLYEKDSGLFKRITAEAASDLMGREEFLMWLSSSAFQWRSMGAIPNSNYEIAFDSGLLFQQDMSEYSKANTMRKSLEEVKLEIEEQQKAFKEEKSL